MTTHPPQDNPTEEQTSGDQSDYWKRGYQATFDELGRAEAKIDRLRAALERIEREAEDRQVWRLGSKMRMGFYVIRDIAREALDG